MLSFFSDWHKDVFGVRPYGSKNVCRELLNIEHESEETEEEER